MHSDDTHSGAHHVCEPTGAAGTRTQALVWPSQCTQVLYQTSPFLSPSLFSLSSVSLERLYSSLVTSYVMQSIIQRDGQPLHCLVITQERRKKRESPEHTCDPWWGLYNDNGNNLLISLSFLCDQPDSWNQACLLRELHLEGLPHMLHAWAMER